MADVKLPQLGESVTEGTLGKWLKQVGESILKYEALVEITTDKVNAEVPSDFEGVLEEVFVTEGETVRVGTVICRIREIGDTSDPTGTPALVAVSDIHSTVPINSQARIDDDAVHASEHQIRPAAGGRYSPAVLKLADEHGIDLRLVSGSGEGGRITRKDILAYVNASHATSAMSSLVPGPASTTAPEAATPSTQSLATVHSSDSPDTAAKPVIAKIESGSVRNENTQSTLDADVTVINPSPVRKTIARRMVESKHTAPHAWTMVESDVTSLVNFRTGAKSEFKKKQGIDLTFMAFFIKAVVAGLKQYPMLNASWIDDQIHIKKRIHISIAVATDDALVVPVIHDADRLSIAGLAHAVNDLAARARSGRLTLADVQGGTFTVNNTGAFGSVLSQPIINTPQAAILSFESIVKRPVVIQDAIAIRSMMNLSLSLDHRILDGWVSGQFLQAIKQRLEGYGVDTVLY